ncbi:Kinesin motor domain family protein [Leishmania donovani]|uniref:Kinesin motor domain family protein n=1 Tax=Leishmania donovani TaxID=5661 RepID=A0A504XU42_LEIDO|nr:Kinesin motor domain family protein [Leishmania donovani]
MEFKRSNSSRGQLASASRGQPVKSSRGGSTPLRSTPPTNSATPPKPAKHSNAFERSVSGTGSKGTFKRSATAVGMRRAEAIKHNNRVNVYVRVRAFREDETSGDMGQLAVNMDDSAVEVTVPKKGRFTFGFDGCFWSNDRACPSGKASASQEDVFDEVGRPLVENALAGYNAAVMAYGQTGSGKTYTSFGPPGSIGTSQEGLIPRVCNMIFSRAANSAQKGVTYTVSASMLEVYLEDVFDLLNHRKQLSVRNDFTSNTFSVVGQKTVPVNSYMDVLAVLNKAEPLRTFAATNIHDHSSRAHTLFMLEVQTHFDAPDLAPRCAKILLADLAGCERIRLAGTEEGLAFEQARNINLSLLALGSCIEAVATRGRGSSRPIPEFRNSTLTKLLKDYIGGNSISTMMVTISPSERDANLSVQTLRFADRAKQITTHAHVNTVDPQQAKQDGSELGDRWRDEYLRKKEALYAEYQLKGTIEKLLARIAELEARLRECADDEVALHLTTEIEELQKALTEADYQMGLQRQILYGEFLLLEDELRELNTKMQEMKEEHEEAMEGFLARRPGECADLAGRLSALQVKYDADTCAAERARSELEAQLAESEKQVGELAERQTQIMLEEETLKATVERLNADMESTEETLQETSAKLADTEETLQETSAKLADTEETLQETSAKLADTEETLQETSAKLADTEEMRAAEIASLTEQLRVAHSLAEQHCAYMNQLMAYVNAAYNVTLDGMTEVQATALTDMLRQCDYVLRSVAQAASDEVEHVKEMYNTVAGNYKETAARFDILRRILGKIDQDVKEASVEIDAPERRQTGSLNPTPRRLGDVSNRENSIERKAAVS